MIAQRMPFWDVAYALVLGIGVTVAIVHTVLGLYHLAAVTALFVVAGVAVQVKGWSPTALRAPGPELELLDRVAWPRAPMGLRVIRSTGVCALGFRSGDTWFVDSHGLLSSKLCRPAAAAVEPLLTSSAEPGKVASEACRCPLGDRSVTFAAA